MKFETGKFRCHEKRGSARKKKFRVLSRSVAKAPTVNRAPNRRLAFTDADADGQDRSRFRGSFFGLGVIFLRAGVAPQPPATWATSDLSRNTEWQTAFTVSWQKLKTKIKFLNSILTSFQKCVLSTRISVNNSLVRTPVCFKNIKFYSSPLHRLIGFSQSWITD